LSGSSRSGRSSRSSSSTVARETADETTGERRRVTANGLAALEDTAARRAVGVARALTGHELSTSLANVLGTGGGGVDGGARTRASRGGSSRGSRGSSGVIGGSRGSSTTSVAREAANEATRERRCVTANGLSALEHTATRRAVGIVLAFTRDELSTGFADVLGTSGGRVDGRASTTSSGGDRGDRSGGGSRSSGSRSSRSRTTSAAREAADETTGERRRVAANSLAALEDTATRRAVSIVLAFASHELRAGFADVLGTSGGRVDGRASTTGSRGGGSSRRCRGSGSSTTSLAGEAANEAARERGCVTANGLGALKDAAARRAVGVALAFTSNELRAGLADVLGAGSVGVNRRTRRTVNGGDEAEDGEEGDGFHDE
jgi:hypothetical protein